MDTSKIIKGVVSNGRYTVTAPIVKEDYGLYLKIEGVELPSTYEVDFSNSENSGTSVTMIGNADGVFIPHQFISTGKDVFAFLYHVGEDFGRTVYKFRIPNKVRPDRTDETPTPEEQSVIDQTISALNSAVEQTGEDAESASQSAQSAESAKTAAESARDTAGEYANDAESSAASASTSASQASASATASAQSASQSAQIKADVEELERDAQAAANSSGISARASGEFASQAQGFANSASASAQSASGYASQAQSYSQTASAKAQDASGYAQTASQKATESAQSASQALTYKTDAESAKTASQTAQGLAESARDSAISAKNDAEQAKADAESARDEAQQAVASISGALDDKADVITDTASGSTASFSDGADNLPLKSLVVDVNPIQDLHGQDAPYPAGGGKNKFDIRAAQPFNNKVTLTFGADDSLTCKNENGYAVNPFVTIVLQVPTGTYTLSATYLPDRNIGVYGSDDGTTWAWYANGVSSTVQSRTLTIDKTFIRLTAQVGANETATFPAIQIESGSTATSYAPYENICPISGWTQVGVEQSGKNLIPNLKAVGSGLQVNIGQEATGTSAYGVHLKAGTYTLSATMSTQARAYYRESDGTANTPIFGLGTDMHGTFTLSKESDVRIWLYNANGLTPADVLTFQLEYASTATPYEPYTGRSITIDLGQTVYGGKLDVLSGVMTVDRAMVDLGTANWWKSSTAVANTYRYASPVIKNVVKIPSSNNVAANIVCTSFPTTYNNDVYTAHIGVSISITGDVNIYDPRYDQLENTTAEFKAAMDGVILCYEVANPIEIQLSANQINSLYGTNNLWADSGDTEVEYRADTKLFIERLTAPDSADMVADTNITSGKYFMVGNTLYKATANIANGASIIVGTNCIRKSLSEALNEINA